MKNLLVFVSCIVLSACVYNQNTNEHQQGANISSQQIASVEIGKTTKQWILTNFGVPDRTQIEKDGLEVYEYINEHTKKSKKTFIFLFNIDSDKTVDRKVTRVVMRDGMVVGINASN